MLKKSLVENVLATALEQGGEFAEIFFENRTGTPYTGGGDDGGASTASANNYYYKKSCKCYRTHSWKNFRKRTFFGGPQIGNQKNIGYVSRTHLPS